MLDMLSTMLTIASYAHADQVDKAGLPYILHPIKVMTLLQTRDVELMCIALGHDLLEDTVVTLEDFHASCEFTTRVVDGIVALTRTKGQSYDEYKQQVFASKDAMLVKLADLEHNSDTSRLQTITEKDIARCEKYAVFSEEIKQRLQDLEQ